MRASSAEETSTSRKPCCNGEGLLVNKGDSGSDTSVCKVLVVMLQSIASQESIPKVQSKCLPVRLLRKTPTAYKHYMK